MSFKDLQPGLPLPGSSKLNEWAQRWLDLLNLVPETLAEAKVGDLVEVFFVLADQDSKGRIIGADADYLHVLPFNNRHGPGILFSRRSGFSDRGFFLIKGHWPDNNQTDVIRSKAATHSRISSWLRERASEAGRESQSSEDLGS